MATLLSKISADFETSTSGSVSVGDSSFTLQSITDADGNDLSDGVYCFTLDRDNTSAKEYVVGQLTASTKTMSDIYSVSRQGSLTANFQKAHRIGTNAIISNHSSLSAIVDILNGTGTLDSGSPISYDDTATISGANMLATKAYVDSVVNGGSVTYDAQILSAQIAGETIASGELVYLKESDSRWYLVDTDTLSTYNQVTLGIALGAGTSGNTISGGVQVSGICESFTGLTANDTYYATATAGAISTTSTTPKIAVGQALSTTSILLSFESNTRLTGAEKDSLAGGGDIGTPSTSNKFITEDYFSANAVASLLGHTKTSATLANDATETTVYTKTITAGTLGTNDGIKIDFYGVFATSNILDDPYVRVYFDSTEIGEFSIDTVDLGGGGLNSCPFTASFYIINNNSLSAQNVFGSLLGKSNGLHGDFDTEYDTISASENTTKTFDTSSDFDLTLRFKNENADSGEGWTFNWAVVTKLSS